MKSSVLSGLLGPIQKDSPLNSYGYALGVKNDRSLSRLRDMSVHRGHYSGTPSRFGAATDVAISQSALGRFFDHEEDIPPVGKLEWVLSSLNGGRLQALKKAALNDRTFLKDNIHISEEDRVGLAKGWADIFAGISSPETEELEERFSSQIAAYEHDGVKARAVLAQDLALFFENAKPGSARLVEERFNGFLKNRLAEDVLGSFGERGAEVSQALEQLFAGSQSDQALYIHERLNSLFLRMEAPRLDESLSFPVMNGPRDQDGGKNVKGAVFTFVDANNSRFRIEMTAGSDGFQTEGSVRANWVSDDLGSIEISFSKRPSLEKGSAPQAEGTLMAEAKWPVQGFWSVFPPMKAVGKGHSKGGGNDTKS